MRTTITIPQELLKEVMEVSGISKYSEAIVVSLKKYIDLQKRLEMLEMLYSKKTPHSMKKIKSERRKTRWP